MSVFEKGTVVISVDDGRKDAYALVKDILNKYNIPATFNIVTAWIDTSDNEQSDCLTLSELKEMYENPLVEIAGHGQTHKNDAEDVCHGIKTLREWLGIGGEMGFASPGSDMTNEFIIENEDNLKRMGLLYVRSGRKTCPPDPKHIAVFEKAKQKGYSDYVAEYTAQLSYGYDSMCVNSVIVFSYTSLEELKQLTQIAMEEKACVVFMLHGVAKKSEPDDLWNFDFERFSQFAEYLAKLKDEGKIDVLTTREAYIKGRE